MPDAGRTREPCVQRKVHLRTQATQGSRNSRHSLRNGLRLIRDLPGVPGLLASVTCRFVTGRLDASVGAPGPRDFAVRIAPRSSGGRNASIASPLHVS